MRLKSFTTLTLAIVLFCGMLSSCSKKTNTTPDATVQANIKKYTSVWDSIINKGRLDLFNTTNFSPNVIFHSKPSNIVGIDSARAYYANYLTGFSNIKFEIINVFGEGDQLTKHWTFSGTNTGVLFGIPATGKFVSVEGSTIARMEKGIIVDEQDFFDNLDLFTQMGLY